MKRMLLIGGAVLLFLFGATTFVQVYDLPKSVERSKEVYTIYRINCKMSDGNGMKKVYPPLIKLNNS